jgi:hypothetical protein
MGEELSLFRADFNGSLRIETREERITGDAGAILLREVIERLGLGEWLEQQIHDPRNPALITHPQIEMVRTSLLLLGQGWRDQDDADLLRDDPALRLAVSTRRGIGPLDVGAHRKPLQSEHAAEILESISTQVIASATEDVRV